MAHCKQCGARIRGGRFCSSCGASINGNDVAQSVPVAAAATVDSLAQHPIQDVFGLIHFFSEKEAQYIEMEKVTKEIADLSAGHFERWKTAAIVSAILIFVGPIAPIWMVSTVVCIIAYVRAKKKNSKKLEELRLRQSSLDTELRAHYATHPNCPLDFKYTSPQMLYTLYGYINRGANTIGEAIKLYENDMWSIQTHKRKERDDSIEILLEKKPPKDDDDGLFDGSTFLGALGNALFSGPSDEELERRREAEDRWERKYQRQKEEEEFIRKSNDDWYERQKNDDY